MNGNFYFGLVNKYIKKSILYMKIFHIFFKHFVRLHRVNTALDKVRRVIYRPKLTTQSVKKVKHSSPCVAVYLLFIFVTADYTVFACIVRHFLHTADYLGSVVLIAVPLVKEEAEYTDIFCAQDFRHLYGVFKGFKMRLKILRYFYFTVRRAYGGHLHALTVDYFFHLTGLLNREIIYIFILAEATKLRGEGRQILTVTMAKNKKFQKIKFGL